MLTNDLYTMADLKIDETIKYQNWIVTLSLATVMKMTNVVD
jgi:hypothetical protein